METKEYIISPGSTTATVKTYEGTGKDKKLISTKKQKGFRSAPGGSFGGSGISRGAMPAPKKPTVKELKAKADKPTPPEKKYLENLGKSVSQLSSLEKSRFETIKRRGTFIQANIKTGKRKFYHPGLGGMISVSDRKTVKGLGYQATPGERASGFHVGELESRGEKISQWAKDLDKMRSNIKTQADLQEYNQAVQNYEKARKQYNKRVESAQEIVEQRRKEVFQAKKQQYQESGVWSKLKVAGEAPKNLAELESRAEKYAKSPQAVTDFFIDKETLKPGVAQAEKRLREAEAGAMTGKVWRGKGLPLRTKGEGIKEVVSLGTGLLGKISRPLGQSATRSLEFIATGKMTKSKTSKLKKDIEKFNKQAEEVRMESKQKRLKEMRGELTEAEAKDFEKKVKTLRGTGERIRKENKELIEEGALSDPREVIDQAVGVGLLFAPFGALGASRAGGSALFGAGTEFAVGVSGTLTGAGVTTLGTRTKTFKGIESATGIPKEVSKGIAGLTGFAAGGYLTGVGITKAAASMPTILKAERGMAGVRTVSKESVSTSRFGDLTGVKVKQPLLATEEYYIVGAGGARAGELVFPVLEPSVREATALTTMRGKPIKLFEQAGEATIFEPALAPSVFKRMGGLRVSSGERVMGVLKEKKPSVFRSKFDIVSELDFLKRQKVFEAPGKPSVFRQKGGGVVTILESGGKRIYNRFGEFGEAKSFRTVSTGGFKFDLFTVKGEGIARTKGFTRSNQFLKSSEKGVGGVKMDITTKSDFITLPEVKPKTGKLGVSKKISKTESGFDLTKKELFKLETDTAREQSAVSNSVLKNFAESKNFPKKVSKAAKATQETTTVLSSVGGLFALPSQKTRQRKRITPVFGELPVLKTGFAGKTKPVSKTVFSEATLLSEGIAEKTAPATAMATGLGEETVLTEATLPATGTGEVAGTVESVKTVGKQGQLQKLDTIGTTEFITTPAPPPPPPPSPRFVLLPGLKKSKLKGLGGRKAKVPGYNVFVRRRGDFKKVSKKPLQKQNAIAMGSFIADSSSIATFKAKKTGKKVPKKKTVTANNLLKFYRKKDAFIEKNIFRIDTPGEKKQITEKGLASLAERFKREKGLTKKKKKRKRKRKPKKLFETGRLFENEEKPRTRLKLFEKQKNKKKKKKRKRKKKPLLEFGKIGGEKKEAKKKKLKLFEFGKKQKGGLFE